MEQAVSPTLKKTSLNGRHRASGARMVPYAGWEMPLEYSGIGPEHLAVRSSAGLFDVSHMGEIEIAGKDALSALQRLVCSDVSQLAVGEAQYTGILTERGTFLDDLLVYRLGREHYLLVVNAGRTPTDYAWILDQIKDAGDVVAIDASARYGLLALQGPAAADVLQPLTGVPLSGLSSYAFAHGEVANVRATIARTGYTGEDGFEIFVPPQSADRVWRAILASSEAGAVVPAGLGARDTLRLEAAMRLYGSDLDETTTPLEAGLGWMVAWDKGEFNGKSALLEQRNRTSRRLVGFELEAPGIARPGSEVFAGDAKVGQVTSGTRTPFLQKSIGLAYVSSDVTSVGTSIEVRIRDRRTPGRIVPLPFYRRSHPSPI
jgi:aminomethyltransferase